MFISLIICIQYLHSVCIQLINLQINFDWAPIFELSACCCLFVCFVGCAAAGQKARQRPQGRKERRTDRQTNRQTDGWTEREKQTRHEGKPNKSFVA